MVSSKAKRLATAVVIIAFILSGRAIKPDVHWVARIGLASFLGLGVTYFKYTRGYFREVPVIAWAKRRFFFFLFMAFLGFVYLWSIVIPTFCYDSFFHEVMVSLCAVTIILSHPPPSLTDNTITKSEKEI